MEAEVLRRRVLAGEHRLLVEVAVVHRREALPQLVLRQPDVHEQVEVVEPLGAELRLDDKGRAVQALRGAELLAAEGVGDHDVVHNGEAEHRGCLSQS